MFSCGLPTVHLVLYTAQTHALHSQPLSLPTGPLIFSCQAQHASSFHTHNPQPHPCVSPAQVTLMASGIRKVVPTVAGGAPTAPKPVAPVNPLIAAAQAAAQKFAEQVRAAGPLLCKVSNVDASAGEAGLLAMY